MTRTTNAAPRRTSPSTVQSSRSKKSASSDLPDVKHRKGQISAVNPKNDLNVDFSLKKHTVVRVEEASEGNGHPATRSTSAAQLPLQVQLVDLLVPTRKSQKGKGTCTSDVALETFVNRAVVDGDFEVVPHIRPVIVLDDDATPDLNLDEPWEHVFVVDDYPVDALSYAKVAALN